MLSNVTDDSRENDHKRLTYRLPTALLLTAVFFVCAVVRPLDVGHDTALYVETLNAYFVEDAARFPDLLFNGIATAIATVFNQIPGGREVSGRSFLIFIALIESIFMVQILRRKKYILESILLAISYGPLIFLDILRQGLSMLLAGVFLSGQRRQPFYILGALSTHTVSAIALLRIPLKKINPLYFAIILGLLLIVVYLVSDGIAARYEYYARTEGYLSDADLEVIGFSWDAFSIANIFVFLFFFYSAAVGGFTKFEAFVLSILYLLSVFLPILHRVYLFYFFSLSCSRDVLINSKKIRYTIFNILYAVVLLKFSTNAFFTFGGGVN